MERLTVWLRGLALGVALLGVATCWSAVRPADVGQAWTAVRIFVPAAVSTVWLWVALVAMLAATWAARSIEDRLPRLGTVRDAPRPARRVDEGAEEGVPELAEPTDPVRRRRERDARRLRLEAFLRGEPDVPGFVDLLLAAALDEGASDIHIQPLEHGVVASFRVAGQLREAARLPPIVYPKVVRRLKVMADLPPYETARPQDGRFEVATPRRGADRVQVRLSAVPGRYGEKVVLRLAGDATLRTLDQLGLFDEDLERLRVLLAEPQGLLILTGPTGSGKTTTLYSALESLHRTRPGASLSTIEEPIEVDLPFLAQTQVDRARDLGFADVLRAVLRQDPDVLMIGEVRDRETAGVAVQAGLTGHLILTTLHAESALGVFPRLVDLGVEPFLAASSTLGIVAQRLARRLCPACCRPDQVDSAVLERLRAAGHEIEGGGFQRADGCPECSYEGVAGRMALFELLRLDSELRRAITRGVPLDAQRAALRERGHRGLLAAAIERARRGEIALDEALRVAA
ncbi:MAG: GspE/PulE family protein [Acidobacteriota bacterium]